MILKGNKLAMKDHKVPASEGRLRDLGPTRGYEMKRVATGYKGVVVWVSKDKKHNGRPDRSFRLRYRYRGKQYEEPVGWASEGMNAVKASNILGELRNNQITGQGPCTLAEMREQAEAEKLALEKAVAAEKKREIPFKAFFENTFLPDAKTRWKPETTAKAESHVKVWIDPVTGDTPFYKIGLAHTNRIKANMSDAEKSPRTIQYVFRTFAMVWNAALDLGLVSAFCPTKSTSFRLPKVDNEKQRYLSLEEEKTLLEKVKAKSQQSHDMAVVSLDAGLRFGEIAALTWGCVDTEGGTLKVLDTKGKQDRHVPMTNRLKSLFKAMDDGKPSELVFSAVKGGIQKQIPSSFKRGLEDVKLNEGVENSKLKASFHTLRHTYASRLVQSGVDLYKVQRLLGHSTPVMTARYSKLADDDLRQAVQAMEKKNRIQQEKNKVAKVIRLPNSI
jgi:integrase